MAQLLSHRTGSFNSIFRTSSPRKDESKTASESPVRRIASSSNHKLKIHGQNSLRTVRPESPIVHRASEAHIHRIRFANSRGDLKHNLHLLASTANIEKSRPTTVKDPSDSDDDSIESVDWTAPLDITAYLYKPEYIIRPNSRSSKENKDTGSPTPAEPGTSTSNSDSSLKLAAISENKAAKQEFVKKYIKKSLISDRKALFKRDVTDYTAFVKELNNDLREMSQETKRLENYSPRTRAKKHETRDEIIDRGYLTLKRIYELNPDLTESAAKKNICGPPGNHWMGLSRIEVLEVLHRIRNELNVPLDKYENYGPKFNFSRKHVKTLEKKEKKTKKRSKKSKKEKKQLPRLKTPQTPFLQHVPGPKHLHTNVCIRPWEATLDGWTVNQTENETSDSDLYHSDAEDNFKNPPNSPRKATPSGSQTSLSGGDHLAQSVTNEEDYLTLEIFNPIFKVYR